MSIGDFDSNASSDPTCDSESRGEDVVHLIEPAGQKIEEMAMNEGVSVEDFIVLAVAEKIARSEND